MAPVSAQNGFLQIFVTEPGIEITVGDLSPEFATPSKPLEYGLAPGSYVIIAGKAGYQDLIQTAEIRSDQLTKVIINLYQGPPQERQIQGEDANVFASRIGHIKVLSLPADQPVFIDGEERRLRTPMEITGMMTGYYTVKTTGCETVVAVRENTITRIECVYGMVRVTHQETDLYAFQYTVPNRSTETTGTTRSPEFTGTSRSPSTSKTDNAPQSTYRQRSGFEVGVGIGAFLAEGEGESKFAFGAHGTLAYGISERFTLGLYGAGAILNEEDADDGNALATVGGIFGRMYFGAAYRKMRPYLVVGGGQGLYQADLLGESAEATGLAGMLGIGIDRVTYGALGYYLELNYNLINFDKITFAGAIVNNEKLDIDYAVLVFGLRFRF